MSVPRPPARHRWGRRPLAALAVAAACTTLAGCVEIPSDGPVVDARRVDGRNWIRAYPAGPSSTATAGDLVCEFLRASSEPTNDHEVARRFLAPEERVTWRPEAPVVVRGDGPVTVTVTREGASQVDPGSGCGVVPPVSTGAAPGTPSAAATAGATPRLAGAPSASPVVTAPSPSPSLLSAPPTVGERVRVSVQAPVVARIDRSGAYALAVPGETETRHFELIGTNGGWRIADLDPGVMITKDDLTRTFHAMPLYFADPMGEYLVPDLRWFLATTSMPSQAVSALLAGPQDWLQPAVRSGAPVGTRLTVNGVKIADGVATVDLTGDAWQTNAAERMMLKAQLEQTLSSLGPPSPQVTAVVITVAQQKFELQPTAQASDGARAPGKVRPGAEADGSGAARLRTAPPVDPRPVVIDAHGRIARLGVSVTSVNGLEALNLPGVTDPATDAQGAAYAVLAANRTKLLYAVPSGKATAMVVGKALVAPSFDPFGWVWTSQEDCHGVVLAGRAGVGVSRVSAGWLDGWQVRSMRISREGARAVVVAQRPGDGSAAFVASVVRDPQGTPTMLAPLVRLLEDAVDVTSAAWLGPTEVVVLARRPGSASMPWIVQIGGDVDETIPVQAVAVTAGNSESELYVRLANGGVRTRVGSTWIDLPVRYPAMPG